MMFPIYCFRTPLGKVALYPQPGICSLRDFEVSRKEHERALNEAKDLVCNQLFRGDSKEVVPISLDEYLEDFDGEEEELKFFNRIRSMNEKEQP